MRKDNQLPVFGVGPFLVFPIAAVTVILAVMSYYNLVPVYRIDNFFITLIGFALIVLGAIVWLMAVLGSKITDEIKLDNLVTTGIYGIVRHPIYAAFLYAVTGVVLISNNLYLFILPFIFWLILTIAMKNTEEKWLKDKFGDDYVRYSKKVSRFVPFLRI